MICPNCNKELPDGAKFCMECGSNISAASRVSSVECGGTVADVQNPRPENGATVSPSDFSLGNIPTIPNMKGSRADYRFSGDGKSMTDRYEFVEELGQGGFAVVWKALDRKLGRTVAIKKLHSDQDSIVIERFRREAQVIAQLNHRNVVGVYDVAEDVASDQGNEIWLVMEYIGGGSLRDYLKQKGKLEISEAVTLFKGIAQGLAYAHRKNLVHRDIKPANILLKQDGEELVPKIVDFGLAQAGRNSELSMSGYGLGTPYYMPPEQQRDAKSVNHTADIYALGKVLYEMVSGQIPDTLDPEEISNPKLSKIIFKCTKSRPEERFFSVDELCRALEVLEGKKQKVEQKSVMSSSVQCPACGLENSADVSFCSGCGAGLYRICPECGRKDFADSRYCSSCGTDVDGFLDSREVLSRMQKHAENKKWSRVVKEFGEWDDQIRLYGEKGKALCADINRAVAVAKQSIEQIEQLSQNVKKLDESIDSKEAEGGQDVVEALQNLRELMSTLSQLSKLDKPSDEQLQIKRKAKERIDRIAADEDLRAEKRKSRMRWVLLSAVAGMVVSAVAGGQIGRFRTKTEWRQAEDLQQAIKVNMGIKTLKAENGLEMEFMPIPAGEFVMGENTRYEHGEVVEKPFWVAKTEVSQLQWRQVMGSCPSVIHEGLSLPIENVKWEEALAFCEKLTEIGRQSGDLPEGYVYTLPTEVQWEYACKAKVSGDYCFGSNVTKLRKYACWSGNSKGKTRPVGTGYPNAWGLFDMHGNVWEWCIAEGRTMAEESSVDTGHVCRGGAWESEWWRCRADSFREFADVHSRGIGVRVVMVSL